MTKITPTLLFDSFDGQSGDFKVPALPRTNQHVIAYAALGNEEAALSSIHAALARVFDDADGCLVGNGTEFHRAERWRCVSGLAALERALGMAYARQVFRQEHWIVALLDGQSDVLDSVNACLTKLLKMPRVLILWHRAALASGGPTLPTAHRRERQMLLPSPAIREIDDVGLPHLGPLPARTADQLITILDQIKADRRAAIVELVLEAGKPAETAMEACPDPPPGADNEPAVLDRGTALSALWKSLTARSHLCDDLVVVNMLDRIPLELSPGFPADRYFEVASDDRDALVWCSGLAAGGCHPCVVIDPHRFAALSSGLLHEVCEGRTRLTFLVTPGATAAILPETDVKRATAAFDGLPFSRIIQPEANQALERTLADASRHLGPTLIWLPAAGLSVPFSDKAVHAPHRQAPEGHSLWQAEIEPSPDALNSELAAVLAEDLGDEMLAWIAAYSAVGRRDMYLWKWCKRGIELTTLSSVRSDLRAHVNGTKLLGVILDVLLDDVADSSRDHVFLAQLIRGLEDRTDFAGLAGPNKKYAEFTGQVWAAIRSRIKTYPLCSAFEELFDYDYAQLFNTMRYANLVNRRLALMNLSEHEVYLPHNMHMMIFGTLDLMCSPTIDPQELGKIREVMWHAQCMGQIGNQITTWQRELNDGDYSSGVFASALSCGDLTVAELVAGNRPRIEAAILEGRHEEHLVSRWKDHRNHLLAMTHQLHSCDIVALLEGLDRLMIIELGSRGSR
ncbi:MAG TPA: hypothetical protein VHV08_09140 [Pirellulales bacterium]|nr:hypothetical protein [Pirellulales bacterium]